MAQEVNRRLRVVRGAESVVEIRLFDEAEEPEDLGGAMSATVALGEELGEEPAVLKAGVDVEIEPADLGDEDKKGVLRFLLTAEESAALEGPVSLAQTRVEFAGGPALGRVMYVDVEPNLMGEIEPVSYDVQAAEDVTITAGKLVYLPGDGTADLADFATEEKPATHVATTVSAGGVTVARGYRVASKAIAGTPGTPGVLYLGAAGEPVFEPPAGRPVQKVGMVVREVSTGVYEVDLWPEADWTE